MATTIISAGTVHELPKDLHDALAGDMAALIKWESLTPLARNEWICWTIYPKTEKTRNEHVHRLIEELKEGKRRPCCWLGCIHRKDKEISPSVRGILEKRKKA